MRPKIGEALRFLAERTQAPGTTYFGLFSTGRAQAQITLLATGTLDQSRAGTFADLSGLKYNLENGVPANLLGGFGSAIAYAGGNTFLALRIADPTPFRTIPRLGDRF